MDKYYLISNLFKTLVNPLGLKILILLIEKGIRVCDIATIDENPETTSTYGIISIPTLVIFKNGKFKSQIVGVQPKEELKRQIVVVLG